MTPAYQSVQSAHSIIEYLYEHPAYAKNWYVNSKYLVFLSVATEKELIELASKLEAEGIVYSSFIEPDIDDSLTAICTISNDKTRKLLSGLPLMLKEIDNNNINKHFKKQTV